MMIHLANINKANWENLKAFFKSRVGFKSWAFEGDYDILVITFKNNDSALKAVRASMDSMLEIGAFGKEVNTSNGVITVELSEDAKRGLSSWYTLTQTLKMKLNKN